MSVISSYFTFSWMRVRNVHRTIYRLNKNLFAVKRFNKLMSFAIVNLTYTAPSEAALQHSYC